MTDLETRLRASLARAADDAPQAVGLADRVRARRRPRRALSTGVGAGLAVAAAVVAIAVVPTLAGDTDGAEDRADTPQETMRDDGWRTVSVSVTGTRQPHDRVDVDIPPSWSRDQLNVRAAVPARGADLPGGVVVGIDSWFGYVTTDDVSVFVDVMVGEDSESTARRVLASVRPEGQPPPDLIGWETETVSDEYSAITALVPDDPRVRVRLSRGIPDCISSPTGRFPARQQSDGSWRAVFCRDRSASVTAPTQALADVVAATVRGY